MASGEEIQARLRDFVGRWSTYSGTERSEAQTFLNEMFACYGSDRMAMGAKFEDFRQPAGFMDLHLPEVCIIEMKAPNRELFTARAQVERYWRESADFEAGITAARWIVLCSFQAFEVWEPAKFPGHPITSFSIEELPERYDALMFLAGPNIEPSFVEHHRELTKEAAKTVAGVFHALKDRSAAPIHDLQRFVLQSVWCMFAEDLGLLDGYPYQTILRDVRAHPERSAAELGFLFRVLNQKGAHNRTGKLAGTRYVNGDLFADPAEVGLNRDEVDLLVTATEFDWTKVDPTIFGSLMEGVLGRDRRWELGAHYTHEADIMKIVTPTIIRPWRERIDAVSSPTEARTLLDELCAFRVLDPACGCGNFLYVAYRELRGIEWQLKQRIGRLASEQGVPRPPEPWPYFPLRNMLGIDIEQSAVRIARVTMWMGHRQMIDQYGEAEPALPLQDLSGIRQGDAMRVAWPETDCIIGNPPFLGASHVRGALGDERVNFLKREFGVGVKDLCTYWFRRSVDHLKPDQRAGLVATNSIAQNLGRAASLDYVVERGGVITDAVASQKWPGEAKVHVSIVNWVARPTDPPVSAMLNGLPVDGIDSSLKASGTRLRPVVLDQNAGRCFEGPSPKAKGFFLSAEETEDLLNDGPIDYRDVVRPYLTANDITNSPAREPSRWVIDFGLMRLEEAMRYPRALAIARERVRPERERNRRKAYQERWWLFAEPRRAMRGALAPLGRYAATPGHAKRFGVDWFESEVLASNATNVFAVEDDFSMGVLLSRAHDAWAWAQASTLKGDLRYTPTSVFMTFPWPSPVADDQRERVAAASRQLLVRRAEICAFQQVGLTKLYNAVDEGAWTDLKALHRDLDVAVAACYGWPASVAQDGDEIVDRLAELNRQISAGLRDYEPFAHL